ncbi:MAG: tyrosine-type recombinase/integrase [Fimbriimonadaceae bacterium]
MQRTRTRKAHGYSVYQRKSDGRWGWAVTIGVNEKGNPDRVQGICRTEAEAKDKALDVLAKHRQGLQITKGKDIKLADYLDQWLEMYIRPHREPKTVAYYSGMVRTHIKPTLGQTYLKKLTTTQVQKLLNDKARPFLVTLKYEDETVVEKRLSGETIRGIRATLRSALSRAYKDGLIAENVASRVETPKTTRKDPDFLKPDEIEKLRKKAIGHPLERLVVVALHTGLRIGEATGLRWQDVDFELRTIRIQSQLQRVDGKLALKSLKSTRSNRTLPLAKPALDALQSQKADHVMQASTTSSKAFNPLSLVFLNPEGRPFDPKYVDSHLKTLMVSAGLRPLSFHKLRHTAATLMLAEGIPLANVRDMLGHSQIALTANTYGHAVPEALRGAAEALERAMVPKAKTANDNL